MPDWTFLALPFLISTILIYFASESESQVKSYEYLNFSRASFFQFQAYRYIIGLNRTSESKVMVVWICLALPCLIWSITIYFALEFDIAVKFYDYLNFLSASVVQFWSSWYIIGLNRTSESKVMPVWTCLALPFLISSISIYFALESDSRVKS